MNYLQGGIPLAQPNIAYYGNLVPMSVGNRRSHDPYGFVQEPFINQPSFHPQNMGMVPQRRNPYMGPSLSQNFDMRNSDNFISFPNPNSPMRRPQQPSFNASLPPELKNELPGLYNNNMPNSGSHSTTNYHSHTNQIPSTFALASNNLLRRSDNPTYQQTASTNNVLRESRVGSLPQFPSQPVLQNHNDIIPTQKNDLPHASERNSERRHVPTDSLDNLINKERSPHKKRKEKKKDHPNSLARVGAASLEGPLVRSNIPSFNTGDFPRGRNQFLPQSLNGSPMRISTMLDDNEHHSLNTPLRINNPYQSVPLVNPYSNGISSLYRRDHANDPTYEAPAPIQRPVTFRIAISNLNPETFSLQSLRSAFNTDEALGQELIRINEMINFMIGTPENQTNWVASFIEQFFNQIGESTKPKGLADEAFAKLKTKTFKGSKKQKAKKDVNESIVSEQLCAICLVDYEDGDTQCILSCDHNFHKDCIKAWLEKKAECPTCRQAIE